jgi:hypothetical protein
VVFGQAQKEAPKRICPRPSTAERGGRDLERWPSREHLEGCTNILVGCLLKVKNANVGSSRLSSKCEPYLTLHVSTQCKSPTDMGKAPSRFARCFEVR